MATIRKRVVLALSDMNRVIGESHPLVKLTNAQVDEIRELHEEFSLGYRRLAKKFGVSRDTIRGICTYRRRATSMHRSITRIVIIHTPDEEDGVREACKDL